MYAMHDLGLASQNIISAGESQEQARTDMVVWSRSSEGSDTRIQTYPLLCLQMHKLRGGWVVSVQPHQTDRADNEPADAPGIHPDLFSVFIHNCYLRVRGFVS